MVCGLSHLIQFGKALAFAKAENAEFLVVGEAVKLGN